MTNSHKQEPLEAKYGLSSEVLFCKRCVMSNQRPSSAIEFRHTIDSKKKSIQFDAEGICSACRFAEQKKKTDWGQREKELMDLCDQHRRDDGAYDCIVPGSGGKDSFYAAHILKYKYKMNPLTVTWAPNVFTDWGWKNHRAWVNAGFDNNLCTPNGKTHRLLTRLSVENLFHPFQAFIIGQKSLAPKTALQTKIPLIFYGENEAEYGSPISDLGPARQHFDFFSSADTSDLYLGGTSVKDLYEKYGMTKNDLNIYFPVNPNALQEANVQVHYLGYYLKWHPQSCYYYAVENGGFQASPERTPGTYGKYESIDDKIDDLHYWTTYIKFGVGRASYEASQEIRSGDINREEGVALVKRFDGEWPARFEAELMKYLSIPENEFPIASKQFKNPIMTKELFWEMADRFRSPHLWTKEGNEWKLRATVFGS